MGAFDKTARELWEALGRSGPPPAGGAATFTIDDIEIRLTDRGRHVRARASAGPLAAEEPQRSAQVRTALQLTLGRLRRGPVFIHIGQDQGRPVILVEKVISYKDFDLESMDSVLSKMTRICHTIANRNSHESFRQNGSLTSHDHDETSVENEIIFRL